jgi:hypothetical protein
MNEIWITEWPVVFLNNCPFAEKFLKSRIIYPPNMGYELWIAPYLAGVV